MQLSFVENMAKYKVGTIAITAICSWFLRAHSWVIFITETNISGKVFSSRRKHMNVEYINPFIESSIRIINQTTGRTASLGKVKLGTSPYREDCVVIVIGLTGQISGNAVICMSNKTACNIASLMMGGMPVPELDEIAKSAIGELGNMILGNTATLFSVKKIFVDITPPTLFIGDRLEIVVHKSVVVSVPLLLDSGDKIDIDISYTDK